MVGGEARLELGRELCHIETVGERRAVHHSGCKILPHAARKERSWQSAMDSPTRRLNSARWLTSGNFGLCTLLKKKKDASSIHKTINKKRLHAKNAKNKQTPKKKWRIEKRTIKNLTNDSWGGEGGFIRAGVIGEVARGRALLVIGVVAHSFLDHLYRFHNKFRDRSGRRRRLLL